MIEQDARVARGGEHEFFGRQCHAGHELLDRTGPGQMRVRLDETGHQRGAAAVVEVVAVLGERGRLRRRERDDPVALHAHLRRKGRGTAAIEYTNVLKNYACHDWGLK
ncbi:hypothetical protein [Burkholderia multivorans]|uniref:hypothetical protein n=1 Tax=Burkholderia multivorans TaxID=87883 RepID=UPI00345E48D8